MFERGLEGKPWVIVCTRSSLFRIALSLSNIIKVYHEDHIVANSNTGVTLAAIYSQRIQIVPTMPKHRISSERAIFLPDLPSSFRLPTSTSRYSLVYVRYSQKPPECKLSPKFAHLNTLSWSFLTFAGPDPTWPHGLRELRSMGAWQPGGPI